MTGEWPRGATSAPPPHEDADGDVAGTPDDGDEREYREGGRGQPYCELSTAGRRG